MNSSLFTTVLASIAASSAVSWILVTTLASGAAPGPAPYVSAAGAGLEARLDQLSAELQALREQGKLAPVPSMRMALQSEGSSTLASGQGATVDSLDEAEAAAMAAAQPWPGGFATAQETIQAILEAGPESEAAKDMWAEAAAAGQLHELLAAMEAEMESVPESADKHYDRATSYYAAASAFPSNEDGNWWVDSNQAFTKALEYNPEHWKARYAKARNMSFWPPAYGGQAEAIGHFETLVDQQERGLGDPARAADHPKTYVWLGNLYAQQGRTAEARAAWQRGLKAFPGDGWLTERLDSLR